VRLEFEENERAVRVDQLVPAFHRGDAIGDTALHMKRFLRSQGYESEIFCLNHDEGLEGEAKLVSDLDAAESSRLRRAGSGDAMILHYALPSALTQILKKFPGQKAIIYHNITPAEFFEPYSPEMARISRAGREELAGLAPAVDLGLADSEYNRQELEKLGFRNTAVFPLFVDFAKYDKEPSRFVHDLYRDERTNILFVGRIVPNKKIEDLIRVTFYYKKYISPLVRLIIVGKTGSLPKYYESLIRMADEFYLKPEEVLFTGHIPDPEMFALYRASDVFLSLSEHEGFCLPLIESLVFELPVVAYDSTAVPFTLGGAGVLIRTKRPDVVSELIYKAAHDRELRAKILEGQRTRLRHFRDEDRGALLLDLIKGISNH
jgi:glycosyltransferase involved in cell wall biosynthesis